MQKERFLQTVTTYSPQRGVWQGISYSNTGREIWSGLANFHEVKHLGFTSDSHFPGIIQHKHCIFVHGHLTFLLFDETTVCLPLVVTAIFPLLRFAVELPTPTPRTIHLFYFAYCWFFKGKQAMLFKQVRFVSRFYSNQVLHKTRIRSHLHCLIFLFPLIIPLLFLLPMQFSFFSNIIQNYREFRYCFFYICNCSDTLSQLDLYLTSRFPWADRCILWAVNIANQGYRNFLALWIWSRSFSNISLNPWSLPFCQQPPEPVLAKIKQKALFGFTPLLCFHLMQRLG